MKIASQLPSNLAASTDVVDRNVVSNIEIHQEAMYPLESAPDLFLVPAVIVTPVLRQSFFHSNFGSVQNGAALTVLEPHFGKGLWHFRIFYFYASNYTGVFNTGLTISLRLPGGSPALIAVTPYIGQESISHDFKLLIEDDSSLIQAGLGANGVGQAHFLNLSIIGEKYL